MLLKRIVDWLCPEEKLKECERNKAKVIEEIVKCDKTQDEMAKDILDLKSQNIELVKLVPKINPLEKKLNNKYPKKTIVYKGRSIPNYGNYELGVRNFFVNSNSSELQKIAGKWKKLPDDEKAVECQKWVKKYIKYVSDKKQYGMSEYWAYPSETLKTKRGDCDDQAILDANLMMASGIPYWKIRLSAGNVYDKKGKPMGGHCFVCYYVEEKDYWVAHDTTFYPDLRPINQRSDYKESILYGKGEVWFSWNKNFSFSKLAR